MANLFYGVCSSADSAGTKIINRSDAEKMTAIEEGDLLVVYFANGNTVKSPTLHIDNLTDNQGLVVKTQNVEEGSDDMWQPGEVVSFVLVSQQLNTDNDTSTEEGATTYNAGDAPYWVLNEGCRATTEWYGMTKLFDVLDNVPPDNWPNNVAATPALVEWVYNQIPKDEDGNVITKIEYITDSEDKQPNEQGRFRIYYNQDSTPIEYIIYDTNTTYTNTSEFFNDANGNGQAGTNTADGTYYITNKLGANFYLSGDINHWDTDPDATRQYWRMLKPEQTNNKLIVGDGFGTVTAKGATIQASNLTQNGTIVATGAMSEFNTPLTQRYSPLLYTKSWNTGTLTIGSKDTCQQTVTAEMAEIGGGGIYTSGSKTAHCHINVTVSGYKAVGLIGWNVNKVTNYSAADAKWANIWECRLESSNTKDFVNYAVMNLNNATIHVNVTFTVLYQKVL